MKTAEEMTEARPRWRWGICEYEEYHKETQRGDLGMKRRNAEGREINARISLPLTICGSS